MGGKEKNCYKCRVRLEGTCDRYEGVKSRAPSDPASSIEYFGKIAADCDRWDSDPSEPAPATDEKSEGMAGLIRDLGLTREEVMDKIVDKVLFETYIDDEAKFRKSTVYDSLEVRVKEAMDAKIEELAEKYIIPRVSELIEGMVLQETNRFGENRGEPKTFTEYLVARAENYMTEEVDSDGKSKSERKGSSFYGTKTTRIAHLIDRHLWIRIESAMKEALKEVDAMIGDGVAGAVKISLEKLLKSLKVRVPVEKG